jgi:hypothetical protein
MTALVIVDVAPRFEHATLRAIVRRRPCHHFPLQHLMHLFVGVVIDPFVAAHELDFYPQSMPPQAQFR